MECAIQVLPMPDLMDSVQHPYNGVTMISILMRSREV